MHILKVLAAIILTALFVLANPFVALLSGVFYTGFRLVRAAITRADRAILEAEVDRQFSA